MGSNLKTYNQKRNFEKTDEPKGKRRKTAVSSKLKFVVQHHLARKNHYDFRLEWKGVLLSWAVPKGPSYNPDDKRLAIMVEDHPLEYGKFEGTIPKGQYGGGTVMLWDEGTWQPYKNNVDEGLKKGSLKFELNGKRLMGKWALIKIKDTEQSKNNWLLIKEKDSFQNLTDISKYNTGINSGLTMPEIEKGIKKPKQQNNKKMLDGIEKQKNENSQITVAGIKITNPQKIMFGNAKKIDIVKYYSLVADKILPYLENRIVSIVRCPQGQKDVCFFKKHPSETIAGIVPVTIKNSNSEDEEYFYIKNISGLIYESQFNTIEFHIWASRVKTLEKPDYMVFDLDPDENLGLKQVRQGVKDLKSILDKLSLVSFLKTSGGKGYHVVVPFTPSANWENFYAFAKNIAKLMEQTWPEKYTANMRKIKRKNKIFIDAERNTRSATSVAPYSVRARKNMAVSMPITWKELDKVAPDEISIEKALKRTKKTDPWKDFFTVKQELKD